MSQDENNNQSEITRIKQQIEEEQASAYHGLHGLALGMSQHEFITARMERMGALHDRLKEIVGDEEAAKILSDALALEKGKGDGKE